MIWSLEFHWSLDLGAWSFPLPVPARFPDAADQPSSDFRRHPAKFHCFTEDFRPKIVLYAKGCAAASNYRSSSCCTGDDWVRQKGARHQPDPAAFWYRETATIHKSTGNQDVT